MKIIDVHAHYGKWFILTNKNSMKDTLEIMRKYSIEKAILSSSLAIIYDFVEGNRELAKAIKGYKNLFGYVFLNPNYLELSLREMKKYLSKKNFVGLKLYSNGYINQPLNCKGHEKFLEVLAKDYPEKGIILFHCWFQSVSQLIELAKEFPTLKFIMGHMGGIEWKEVVEKVKEVKNVYLEICSGYPLRNKIEDAVKAVGAQRILFGSDMTLLDPGSSLGMVLDAEISLEKKERILYKNAKELFPR
ncbi:amidohydrolase [candidate division WOR-3 bacterium]|nr:amidohydrolase [candidate division WOR-3 bacterium]